MLPSTASQKENGASTIHNKRKSKKSRKKHKPPITTGEPSCSTSTSKTEIALPKESETYVGYDVTQSRALAQTTTEEICEGAAAAVVPENTNYKLGPIPEGALVNATLSSRRRITADDISYSIQELDEQSGFGIPGHRESVKDSVQDPVTDLYNYVVSGLKNVQLSSFTLRHESFLPCDSNLTKYFQKMCTAVVDDNNEVRISALKDISSNTSIGPVIERLYNFCFLLLKKDVTYASITTYALEFLECLELNPLSSQIISEAQLVGLAGVLFQRLLKANSTAMEIKPVCHMITFMCRKMNIRNLILNKMHIKDPFVRRFFIFPVLCLANEMGIDAIWSFIADNLPDVLSILKSYMDPNFVFEVLRAYALLCGTKTCTLSVTDPFLDIYGDGLIPFWKNVSYPSETITSKGNWLNVKKELYKTRRAVFPPPDYNQKTFNIKDVFSVNEKLYERYKNSLVQSITFKTNKNKNYIVIGKRTLQSCNSGKNSNKSVCSCHSLMFHNL